MKNKRRDFIKLTGAAGLGIATNMFNGFAQYRIINPKKNLWMQRTICPMKKMSALLDCMARGLLH